MAVPNGALSYRKSTNNFYVNETGTNDGWVPLPISINPEDLTSKDVEKLLEKLGGSNQYQIYVDGSNPLASDVKDNKGNSKLRPFRTLQRALLEVARRSFKKGVDNDLFERVSVVIAPGEYDIYNGPASEVGNFDQYGRYQDGANLILKNADWIINEAWNTIPLVNRTARCKDDLRYFLNAIVDDLSLESNRNSLVATRALVTTDLNINCGEAGYFIPAYTDGTKRTQTITALDALEAKAILALKNEGPVVDAGIVVDATPGGAGVCTDVQNTVNTLFDFFTTTLNCTVDHRLTPINSGAVSISNFPDGEPTGEFYQAFNAANRAGVILPRGVSIIGEDLRKTVFRPQYVPPKDGSASSVDGRGAIFRMTGANFFSGFTVKDKIGLAESHHNLSVFEFCTEQDLITYYENARLSFGDYSIYYRALDAANLIDKNIDWISALAIPSVVASGNLTYAKIFEAEIQNFLISIIKDLRNLSKVSVTEFGARFRESHILVLDPGDQAAAQAYYISLLEDTFPILQLAMINEANTAQGGYRDSRVIIDTSQGGRCADVVATVSTYINIIKTAINGQALPTNPIADEFSAGDVEPRLVEYEIVAQINPENPSAANSVFGASPYIFSASLRSQYGMCGIDGDGKDVSGLKSYLAAQFTIISLQKDLDVFETGTDAANKEVSGKRFIGSSVQDNLDLSSFGYKVANGAYAQLVSCFCIGPAKHYIADSGGEFSITNSTSNFGDVSLYSYGFIDDGLGHGAYAQDSGHKLIGLIRPKSLDLVEGDPQVYSLGSIASYEINTSTLGSGETIWTSNWSTIPATWKNWVNDFNTINQAGTDLIRTYPSKTEFEAVTYVKLRLIGQFKNLGPSISLDENGLPELKYIYISSHRTEDPGEGLAPTDLGFAPTNLPTDYNKSLASNIETLPLKFRAPVHSVREIFDEEDDIWYSDIIVDLSQEISTNRLNVYGEWFERDTLYYTAGKNKTTISTSIVGKSIWIERYIDNRANEEKRFKLIFLAESPTKRLPPENYILRKLTGVTTNETQPFRFKSKDNAGLDSIYYVGEIQQLTPETIDAIETGTNDTTLIKEFINTEDYKVFAVEVYSGNSDSEFRLETRDDISLNVNDFYFYEDAQSIRLDESLRDDYLNKVSISDYLSKFNTHKILKDSSIVDTIEGSSTTVADPLPLKILSVANQNRIVLFDQILSQGVDAGTVIQYEFNKPSTIRASGQTWEYMGYYNYDSSIPELQSQNLGENPLIASNKKAQFKLEKLQKSIFGGRIYATGMDELGNVIQGNTIFDLKTGREQTILRGTSQAVDNANEQQQFNSSQILQNITINNGLTVGSGTVNLSSATELIVPNSISTNSNLQLDTGDNNLSIIGNTLDISGVDLAKIDPRTVNENTQVYNAIEIPASQWTLARKAKDTDLAAEEEENAYVTPAQLKTWRIEKGIETTKNVSYAVCVGLGWINPDLQASTYATPPGYSAKPAGDGPVVTDAILASLDAWSRTNGGLGFQCTDPLESGGATFRPLRDFQEVQKYAERNGYGSSVQLDLKVKPGIYNVSRVNFACGISLNGAVHTLNTNGTYVQGLKGMGRYDGKDQFDVDIDDPRDCILPTVYTNGSWGNEYVSGLRSVILVTSPTTRSDYYANNIAKIGGFMSSITPYIMTVRGENVSIANIITWGSVEYSERATKDLWVNELMAEKVGYVENSGAYDEDYDLTNNLFKLSGVNLDHSNKYSLVYRLRRGRGISSMEHTAYSDTQNILGFNHPPLRDACIPQNLLIESAILLEWYASILDGKTNITPGVIETDTTFRYITTIKSSGGEEEYSFFRFLNGGDIQSKVNITNCIFGPHTKDGKILCFDGNYKISLVGNSLRGNTIITAPTTMSSRSILSSGTTTIPSTISISGAGADLNIPVIKTGLRGSVYHSEGFVAIRPGSKIKFDSWSPHALSLKDYIAFNVYDYVIRSFAGNCINLEKNTGGNLSCDSQLVKSESEELKIIPYGATAVVKEFLWGSLKYKNINKVNMHASSGVNIVTSAIESPDPDALGNISVYGPQYYRANHLRGKAGSTARLPYETLKVADGFNLVLNSGTEYTLFEIGNNIELDALLKEKDHIKIEMTFFEVKSIDANNNTCVLEKITQRAVSAGILSTFEIHRGTGPIMGSKSLIVLPSTQVSIDFTPYRFNMVGGPGPRSAVSESMPTDRIGLFVENMRNSANPNPGILSDASNIRKGLLYKVVATGSNSALIESVGGTNVTLGADSIFKATANGTALLGANQAEIGTVELIGGAPLIFTPEEKVPDDINLVIGTEIGQFTAHEFSFTGHISGALGSIVLNLENPANDTSILNSTLSYRTIDSEDLDGITFNTRQQYGTQLIPPLYSNTSAMVNESALTENMISNYLRTLGLGYTNVDVEYDLYLDALVTLDRLLHIVMRCVINNIAPNCITRGRWLGAKYLSDPNISINPHEYAGSVNAIRMPLQLSNYGQATPFSLFINPNATFTSNDEFDGINSERLLNGLIEHGNKITSLTAYVSTFAPITATYL